MLLRGERYLTGTFTCNSQALVMPRELIEEYLSWVRDTIPEETYPRREDDIELARYLREQRVLTTFTVPSIVEHRQDLPSTLGHPFELEGRKRQATVYASNGALRYDWSRYE